MWHWHGLSAGLGNQKEHALTSDGSTPDMAANLATAYHEAGHAVIALALGRTVQRVIGGRAHLGLQEVSLTVVF